jgi:hypothetical protein
MNKSSTLFIISLQTAFSVMNLKKIAEKHPENYKD